MHVILFYVFSLLLVNPYTIEYMVRLFFASGKEMTVSPSPLLIFYYTLLFWHVDVYLSLVAYSKLPRHIYIFRMLSFFIIFQHDVFYFFRLQGNTRLATSRRSAYAGLHVPTDGGGCARRWHW